jgi:hypothetical protein
MRYHGSFDRLAARILGFQAEPPNLLLYVSCDQMGHQWFTKTADCVFVSDRRVQRADRIHLWYRGADQYPLCPQTGHGSGGGNRLPNCSSLQTGFGHHGSNAPGAPTRESRSLPGWEPSSNPDRVSLGDPVPSSGSENFTVRSFPNCSKSKPPHRLREPADGAQSSHRCLSATHSAGASASAGDSAKQFTESCEDS